MGTLRKEMENYMKIKGYSIYAISAFGYSKYEFVKDINYAVSDIVFY